MIHVGTMGWSYPFWVGNFYPRGLAQGGFLEEYAKHFSTVEVDSTFYRIPNESTVEGWDRSVPNGFIFSAKFPKKISYDKRLKGTESDARVFVARMDLLGEKLGSLLLQLPPDFRMEEVPALEEFLDSLPPKHRYAVEAKGKVPPAEVLIPLLKERDVAVATIDSPQVPMTEALTSSFFYVRLEGDGSKVKGVTGKVEVDRKDDLVRWASRLSGMDAKAGEVFVYCSKRYSGHSPSDALMIKQLLATA